MCSVWFTIMFSNSHRSVLWYFLNNHYAFCFLHSSCQKGCIDVCPKNSLLVKYLYEFLISLSLLSSIMDILENLCLWPLPPDGPSSPSPLLSLTPHRLSLFSSS
ncbi:hypothetical protein E2320_011842, partial [Naja naja]